MISFCDNLSDIMYIQSGVVDENVTSKEVESTSQEEYKSLEIAITVLSKWPTVVYTPLGLFGNFMTFLISLSKENRAISVCVYMCALSIVDSIVLLNNFSYRILHVHGLGDIHDRRFSIL